MLLKLPLTSFTCCLGSVPTKLFQSDLLWLIGYVQLNILDLVISLLLKKHYIHSVIINQFLNTHSLLFIGKYVFMKLKLNGEWLALKRHIFSTLPEAKVL